MDDRQRFLEASALSAAGRLAPHEAVWMAGQLRLHPEWEADVRAHAGVVADLRAAQRQDARATPSLSFEAALALLPAEAPPVRAAAPAPANPGWFERLHRWWQRPSTMGLSLAVVAGLALLVALQTRRVDDAQLRLAIAAANQADRRIAEPAPGPIYRGAGPLARAPLTLRLDPAMPLGDMVRLLRQEQLVVVDGPSADGVFLVETPADGADAKVAALRRVPQVLSVQRVAGGS